MVGHALSLTSRNQPNPNPNPNPNPSNFCGSGCFEVGFCPSGSGEVFQESCCPDNCNDRGYATTQPTPGTTNFTRNSPRTLCRHCDSAPDFSSYTCRCDLLYAGDSCGSMSLYQYLFIALGLFIFLFGLLSLRYYLYYRKQPNKILEVNYF